MNKERERRFGDDLYSNELSVIHEEEEDPIHDSGWDSYDEDNASETFEAMEEFLERCRQARAYKEELRSRPKVEEQAPIPERDIPLFSAIAWPPGNCQVPHGPHGSRSPRSINRHQAARLRVIARSQGIVHADADDVFDKVFHFLSARAVEINLAVSLTAAVLSIISCIGAYYSGASLMVKASTLLTAVTTVTSLLVNAGASLGSAQTVKDFLANLVNKEAPSPDGTANPTQVVPPCEPIDIDNDSEIGTKALFSPAPSVKRDTSPDRTSVTTQDEETPILRREDANYRPDTPTSEWTTHTDDSDSEEYRNAVNAYFDDPLPAPPKVVALKPVAQGIKFPGMPVATGISFDDDRNPNVMPNAPVQPVVQEAVKQVNRTAISAYEDVSAAFPTMTFTPTPAAPLTQAEKLELIKREVSAIKVNVLDPEAPRKLNEAVSAIIKKVDPIDPVEEENVETPILRREKAPSPTLVAYRAAYEAQIKYVIETAPQGLTYAAGYVLKAMCRWVNNQALPRDIDNVAPEVISFERQTLKSFTPEQRAKFRKVVKALGEDTIPHSLVTGAATIAINAIAVLTMGAFRVLGADVADLTKLIAQKNILRNEFNDIKDFFTELANECFDLNLGPAAQFHVRVAELLKSGDELSKLNTQDVYADANYTKIEKWILDTESFLVSAKNIKELCQAPSYTLLTLLHNNIRTNFEIARRSRESIGFRQEPVVIHLYGPKGSGKTYLATYMREYISKRLGISNACYDVNLSASGGFFPAYSNQPWMRVDEFLGSVDDPLATKLNGLASTGPFKMEGASLAEKNQWCNVKFIILISNVARRPIPSLTPQATEALFSRLKTHSVRFPGQDNEDPRSSRGRTPNCSNLRIDKLNFRFDVAIPEYFTLESARGVSLSAYFNSIIDEYNANKAAFEARVAGGEAAIPEPANRVLPCNEPLVEGEAAGIPLRVRVHAASLPFIVAFSGDPGAGKTHFANEYVQSTFANLFNLPIVNVLNFDGPFTKPAIYMIDDVLTENNVPAYMAMLSAVPTGSIIWLCTNLSIVRFTRLRRMAAPIIRIGIPMPAKIYDVAIRGGCHAGIARRLGLSGYVKLLDADPVYVSANESCGIHFRCTKDGIKRETCLWGETVSPPLDPDRVVEEIMNAKFKYDKNANVMATVYDAPIVEKEYDIKFQFNTLQDLANMLNSDANLISAFTDPSASVAVSERVFAMRGPACDPSNWKWTDFLSSADDFKRLAQRYALMLWSSAPDLSACFKAGPYAAVYDNGVLNICGSTSRGIASHVTSDNDITVVFDDGFTVRSTKHEMYLLCTSAMPKIFAHVAAHRVIAIKAYMADLVGSDDDPIRSERVQGIQDNAASLRVEILTKMKARAYTFIAKNPLLSAVALLLVSVGIIAGIVSALWPSNPSEMGVTSAAAIEHATKVNKKLKKEKPVYQVELTRAANELQFLSKYDVKRYNSYPTDFPELWTALNSEVRANNKRARGGRKANPNGYDPDEEDRNAWMNNATDEKRRDVVQDVDNFRSLGPSADAFARMAAGKRRMVTRREYARYRDNPDAFEFDADDAFAYSMHTVKHGAPLPINDAITKISESACLVQCDHDLGTHTTMLTTVGLCLGGSHILTVAHVLPEKDAKPVVTITEGDEVKSYHARVVNMSRKYELAVLKVDSPAWKAKPKLTGYFVDPTDPVPRDGISVRPATAGRPVQVVATPITARNITTVTHPFRGTTAAGTRVNYREVAYVSDYHAMGGPFGLRAGDCGSPLCRTDVDCANRIVCGIYTGVCGHDAYWVKVDSFILRELMTEVDSLLVEKTITFGEREAVVDLDTAMFITRPEGKKGPHTPRLDLTPLILPGTGGQIGSTRGDYSMEKDKKPCRMKTCLPADFLPSSKVPVPSTSAQVPDKSKMVPIPAGLHRGKYNMVLNNVAGQFCEKKQVPWPYYERAILDTKATLPPQCLSMRKKTIMEVLNGGAPGDEYRTVRSSVDVHTAPGVFYEHKFNMHDKTLFFRGQYVNGNWIPDRPLVIDTSRPPGACLMERFKAIAQLAREGKTLLCISKNFMKQELIKKSKAETGAARTIESNDFALNMWMDSVLADFYERRQMHRNGQYMVIGTTFRTQGQAMYRHLLEKNPKECMAIDVPQWDRRTSPNVIKAAIKLAFAHARASPEYEQDDIDNIEKAMIAYAVYNVSIVMDAVYWTQGRIASGCRFTAEWNTDGHHLMRRAGIYQLTEEKRGKVPVYDYYNRWVAEVIYGDDNLAAVAEGAPEEFSAASWKEVYARAGYPATNDRKDGDPEFTPYEEASFCSRYPVFGERVLHLALKKDTINSMLQWSSSFEPDHVEAVCGVALQESVPWGEEYYAQVCEAIRLMGHRYHFSLCLPSYKVARFAVDRMVLTGEKITLQEYLTSDLGAQPICANEANIEPLVQIHSNCTNMSGIVDRKRVHVCAHAKCGVSLYKCGTCRAEFDTDAIEHHLDECSWGDTILFKTSAAMCPNAVPGATFPIEVKDSVHHAKIINCEEAWNNHARPPHAPAIVRCMVCGDRFHGNDTEGHACESVVCHDSEGQKHSMPYNDWLCTVPGAGPVPAFGKVYSIRMKDVWDIPGVAGGDPIDSGVGLYKCCDCWDEFTSVRMRQHISVCSPRRILCIIAPHDSDNYHAHIAEWLGTTITECPEVSYSKKKVGEPLQLICDNDSGHYRCCDCGSLLGLYEVMHHDHDKFIQTMRGEDSELRCYNIGQVEYFDNATIISEDDWDLFEELDEVFRAEKEEADNATVHADAAPARKVETSVASSSAPSTMNTAPGSGTIASEGPEAAINFLGPAGAQPVELMEMAGPAIEHSIVARDVFTDVQTPLIKITNMAKRGTIVQTISYLDSSRWSPAMISQAKLNEICGGGVLYEMEMHGPATNGGCLRAVWLPYTPTSPTINIARIAQYPYVEIPMGGDHKTVMCLLDSKLTPAVRKTSDFFSPYNPLTTCCICIYVDQELNNGFNVGASNELYVSYVLRSCFGPYWQMGRALVGKEGEDGIVGRSIASLLGRIGTRLAIGDNNQFWDRSKYPHPSLELVLRNANSFNIRQVKSANNTEVNAVVTRIAVMNGAVSSASRVLAFIHGVHIAGTPNTSYTIPSNSFQSFDNNRVSDGAHSEIVYLNQGTSYDEEIVLNFSTGVPIRLRSVRIICDENGTYALLTFETEQTDVALNDTQTCGLTAVQIRKMLNIFFSASGTLVRTAYPTWLPGPNGYKPATFLDSVYPGNTTHMYTYIDQNLSSAFTDLPGRCVVTLSNPQDPLQQIPLVYYDGLFAVNNSEKYMVTVGLVDDWTVASVSAYPALDLANQVTAALESYALAAFNTTVRHEHAPADVERSIGTPAWALYDRRISPVNAGLAEAKDEVDFESMVWRAKVMGIVHSEGDNAVVHSMIGSIIAGAASGVGGAAQDAIKSKREQKYALERMKLAHGQNLELGLQAGKINLATGLLMTRARAVAQYQLDAARMGLDAASVNRNINSHTYTPGTVHNLRAPEYRTPTQGGAVRSARQEWVSPARRESTTSSNADWIASSRRGSAVSSIAETRNDNVQWGGPLAGPGWADDMEGVELPPREPAAVGAAAGHAVDTDTK